MRKGFTLLELMVVVVILGVLATLGIVQYASVIEKGRRAEAVSVLSTIRSQLAAYQQEGHAGAADNDWLTAALGIPNGTTSTCHNSSYYFQYSVVNSNNESATAYRCSASGKSPDIAAANAYNLTLYTVNGTKTSSPAGLW